ncbi:hypothetical protein I548_1064 [Mycobacterium intracellulare]|nr:hypothetical protein I548_1064 [Mycobacterium intracellulare]
MNGRNRFIYQSFQVNLIRPSCLHPALQALGHGQVRKRAGARTRR